MTPSSRAARIDGLAAFRSYFRADITAGFLVFLIALPLCLGISMASGFPPVAGILTAIVGGTLACFVGSAPLTIKGPAAGLIVIAIGAVQDLGGGDMAVGYRRALAVGVVAAVIQIIFALVRAGTLGDSAPASVVHGMLAAIGVTIFSKQVHTMMGVTPASKEPLHLLAEIPHSVAAMNPEIAVIGIVSLVILFGLPLLPFRWAKRVPAPMIVLLVTIPLGLFYDLDHAHTYTFQGHAFMVGPKYLVSLPGHLIDAITFPDFSVILSGTSIKYVAMFALVGSVESLLSAKAVDSLDPERHQSDMNKDLFATGIANLVAALIGGLPMISEIVRSSANINNGAKSRFANFYHGAFLLVFVAMFPSLLHRIPLAALGAMLIYTGIRLASPKEFVKTFRIGPEQLVVFTFTLIVTLATDLLIGVGAGMVLKIALHLKNGAPLRSLFRAQIDEALDGDVVVLNVKESAVFTNYLGLRKRLDGIDIRVTTVVINLQSARLVDHTVYEKLHHLVEDYAHVGRTLRIEGLDDHQCLSKHELAARRKPRELRTTMSS